MALEEFASDIEENSGWEEDSLRELLKCINAGDIRIVYVQKEDANSPSCECGALSRLWEKRSHFFGLLEVLGRCKGDEYERLSAECRKKFQEYAYLFGELQRKNHMINSDKNHECAKCGTRVPFELFYVELR